MFQMQRDDEISDDEEDAFEENVRRERRDANRRRHRVSTQNDNDVSWSNYKHMLTIIHIKHNTVFIVVAIFCLQNSAVLTNTGRCTCTENKSSQRPHTSVKENMVLIRSQYPDADSRSGLLTNVNGDFLVQSYTCGKFFMKIRSVCPEI